MKKSVLTLLAIIITFLSSTVANAQSYKDPAQAFEYCRMYIQQGDEQYAAGQFVDARATYNRALDCNASCPDEKFMSDRKINKKIKKCDYAISHGGVTREQHNAQVWSVIGSVLAVGSAAAAVATAASSSSSSNDCDASHHDHHYEHHHVDKEYHSISECLRDYNRR